MGSEELIEGEKNTSLKDLHFITSRYMVILVKLTIYIFENNEMR